MATPAAPAAPATPAGSSKIIIAAVVLAGVAGVGILLYMSSSGKDGSGGAKHDFKADAAALAEKWKKGKEASDAYIKQQGGYDGLVKGTNSLAGVIAMGRDYDAAIKAAMSDEQQ